MVCKLKTLYSKNETQTQKLRGEDGAFKLTLHQSYCPLQSSCYIIVRFHESVFPEYSLMKPITHSKKSIGNSRDFLIQILLLVEYG